MEQSLMGQTNFFNEIFYWPVILKWLHTFTGRNKPKKGTCLYSPTSPGRAVTVGFFRIFFVFVGSIDHSREFIVIR